MGKKCRSISWNGAASWAPHRCRLPQGHEGKHVCIDLVEARNGKAYKRAVPCNHKWGRELAHAEQENQE